MDAKPLIIYLMGPTAAGKTDLAVELISRLPCDIISVDSAMVYREMNIGTAKPTADLLKIAPHRLIDICDPSENYSAGQFHGDALTAISEITAQNRIPLLVGGSMMYFRSLQNGILALPAADPGIRETIAREATELGWHKLHERLGEVDPQAAKKIHPNDPQRIQRALEIYMLTGISLSKHWEQNQTNLSDYQVINIALIPNDRDRLHQRIAQRFISMLKNGFITEVEQLYARGDLNPDLPSMRSVGYRQLWDYLSGNSNANEMQERGIAATRQLAKRQLTWLRSWNNLHCIECEDPKGLQKLLELLKPMLI